MIPLWITVWLKQFVITKAELKTQAVLHSLKIGEKGMFSKDFLKGANFRQSDNQKCNAEFMLNR